MIAKTLEIKMVNTLPLAAKRFGSSFHGSVYTSNITITPLRSISRAIFPLNSNWYGSGIRSKFSFSVRSHRRILSSSGPVNLKYDGAWSKRSYSNCHQKSPPSFDICRSEIEFSNSTEILGSENYQPGDVVGDVLRPGMVLLKKYLSLDEQVLIVKECRRLGLGPGGFYRPGYKSGAKLRLMMMCLGLDWDPQTSRYSEIRQSDKSRPPEIPRRLGFHQDRDESKGSLARGLPVVSVSVGDSAEFLYGNDRDMNKMKRVVLESGDVLVFGGKSRHIFHGVQSVIRDSAPEFLLKKTGLRSGRLNLTFRQF